MFYEHIILAKKGPLARIWLAAHWDKKITKAHVFETNIEKSVDGILKPKVKLALRTSGHLLLGVVRIYSRKAKYLLADCNEAFVKIKMAFRPGMVDLPEGYREANVNAITLPEVFHDFDTALPEVNDVDIEAQFSVNQSRADEITIREDFGSLSLSLQDDGFGDIGFESDAPDIMRGNVNEHMFSVDNTDRIAFDDESTLRIPRSSEAVALDGDGFGDDFDHTELFQDDLFDEGSQLKDVSLCVDQIAANCATAEKIDEDTTHASESCNILEAEQTELNSNDEGCNKEPVLDTESENYDRNFIQNLNEDESFSLAPIDTLANKGVIKAKRKRKLIVDEIKNISGEEMKAQLADTSDIISTLDLAPPTKRLMYWKETGGVEKLFTLPSQMISARLLFNNHRRHLISHHVHVEDFSSIVPIDVIALDQYQSDTEPLISCSKRGRKRKHEISGAQFPVATLQESASEDIRIPEQMRNSVGLGNILEDTDSIQTGNPELGKNISTVNNATVLDPVFETNDSKEDQVTLGSIESPPQAEYFTEVNSAIHRKQLTSPDQFMEASVNFWHSEAEVPTPKISIDTGLLSDWNDYDMQHQNSCDQQMEHETDEQFEERVLNKRAAQLFYAIKTKFTDRKVLTISELAANNLKKQAAQKFYSLLVLKKFQTVEIEQDLPYADITIKRGAFFDNPRL